VSTRPIQGRETINGFLRDLNVRLSRLERHTHSSGVGCSGGGGGPVPSEVEVSTSDPIVTNPLAELWFDPDAPTDPFQSINEVWIGNDPPTDPNVELWYDPDATLP